MLTSTNITSESRKKFPDVLQKFDDFFQVRKKRNFRKSLIQSTRSRGDRNYRAVYHFSIQSFNKAQGTVDPRPNRCGHPRFFTLCQVTDGSRFDS